MNYLLSLVSVVVFYVYYTHPEGCTENKVFISINMLLCLGASVVSVLPQIQVSLQLLLSLLQGTTTPQQLWSPGPLLVLSSLELQPTGSTNTQQWNSQHLTIPYYIVLCVAAGVPAAVGPAAVVSGYPLHHVPHLVCHDQ